jgi:hypothetical protein
MLYLWFFAVIAFLVLLLYLLSRFEKKSKNNYRKDAYHLLEQENPDPKKLKSSIRVLRLYGGRLRRDQEIQELILHLKAKLEGSPDIS